MIPLSDFRPLLAEPARTAEPTTMLCRVGGMSCGSCCWSEELSQPQVTAALRRHRQLFERANWTGQPTAWKLLWHELCARRGRDLVWMVLLRVPFLASWLQTRIASQTVCAFVAFDSDHEEQVGCLLHPSLWRGIDQRQQAAFRLLPEFGCGRGDYACSSCLASVQTQAALLESVGDADWYAYSKAIAASNQQNQESVSCR